jgi:putative selenium metabolism hydrolase
MNLREDQYINNKEQIIKIDENITVTQLCQILVKAKSYSGDEALLAGIVGAVMHAFSFDEVRTDLYGNVIGIIKGSKEGPTQVYDAHMDTVVVPDETKWTHDPFGGELFEGKVYGRGTSDMKGSLAAMLIAARDYAKKTGKEFKGRICVAGVVHEECFEGVAAREISKYLSPDYVIIGEASSLNLKHGQRGRAEIVIETVGKPAHSANPERGINAVYHMSEIINEVKQIVAPTNEHLGKGILALTDIISSPYPGASVIPDYCRSTWDRRVLVGETKESVLAPIQEVIDRMQKKDETLKAKVSLATETVLCYTGNSIGDERFFPGWFYEEKEDFVASVHKALLEDGFDSSLTHYNFCTNGSHYAGEAKCKTIGFGPSEEYLAHTIDEYIEVEQLEKAAQGYQVIMGTLESL